MKRKRVLLLLCILNCTLQLFAQQINVQGVVYDPSGETVPGANVSMKSNPAVGTVTDIDGNFSLKASVGDVLVFTFIGYEPIEYKLTAADTNLKVRFTDSSELLDEVVVVGYGVQKKSVLSSAVSRVTSEELDKGNPTNIQNALKGKVSGVQIISNSGQPGAESKIRIRGTGTVNNSDPLYIVDGMPSESGISHLNPSDIESIEVLKDAASAAIYGARGANGVVLITTKKGTKGKATLNYEFTYGIQNPSKKVDLLGSADYQMLMNEMAANAGKDPYFPTVSSVNTDWQKELQNKNAPIMNHKVSLSGGTDNSTYYASFGYVKQEGIYAKGHADYERYNVRLNYNNVLLDTKSRNWLNKISFGAIASYSKSIQTGNTIGNSEAAGLITSMNMLPPTEPVYQTDPAILEQYAVTYPNHVIAPNGLAYNIIEMREITNPLAAMQVSHNQRTMPQNFGANFNLDVDLLPGLKFKTIYGAEWVFNSIKNVTPVYELNATSKNATSKVEDKKRESSYWQWENVLSYTKSFGRHNIGALFGTSMSSYHYSNLEAEDYNLLVVDIDKGYIDTATAPEEQSKVWGGAEDHRIASIFGRINYNYDEKYLFEAVVRRDGSSNFGAGNRWGTFPSASLAWRLSEEEFIKNLGLFNNLKLRFGWGQTGNAGNATNLSVEQITSQYMMYYWWKNGATVTAPGLAKEVEVDTNLKWETNEQFNVGLDLGFFNNKLNITMDYFIRSAKDLLLYKAVRPSTGFESVYTNAGEIRNRGFEFSINYNTQIGKDWSINATLTGSTLKNEAVNVGDDIFESSNVDTGYYWDNYSITRNGYPVGSFYGWVVEGIFQNQAEIDAANAAAAAATNGSTQYYQFGNNAVKPGDYKYKDINGDGYVNDDDRTILGNGYPTFNFGLTLGVNYKAFDFSANIYGVFGQDILSYSAARLNTIYNARSGYQNCLVDYMENAWSEQNPTGIYSRLTRDDQNHNVRVSNIYVKNGNFVKIGNVQLGYTLPKNWVKAARMENVRVYLGIDNLATISGYNKYGNPEIGNSSVLQTGFDYGRYPFPRTYNIGLSVQF